MKREIKFRAWDKKSNSMIIGNVGITRDGKCAISLEDRFELMQYTGLKDKNGKEIYEGDIVRIDDDLIEVIKWVGVGDWMGDKQPMVGFISHGTIYKGSTIEIIGNIYSNPELLSSNP